MLEFVVFKLLAKDLLFAHLKDFLEYGYMIKILYRMKASFFNANGKVKKIMILLIL